MTPTVMRDGRPYAHMVLNAGVVYCLKDRLDSSAATLAIHILAHEAAHVHDLAREDRAFPRLYGTAITDFRESILFSVAHNCWQEYIASILSAGFGNTPERLGHFESTFYSALYSARERGDAAIIAYRTHSDVNRLVTAIVDIYGKALVYAAYLLGHVAGLGKTIPEAAPKAYRLVQDTPYFQPVFDSLDSELRKMYETYGHWSTTAVFEGVKHVAEDLLNRAGIARFAVRGSRNL